MSPLLMAGSRQLPAPVRGAADGGPGPLNQMLDHILEHRRVQLVPDFLAVTLGGDEAGVSEHGEVPRDGGPAGMELIGDLAGCQRTVAEQPEDAAPRLVGEGAKDPVRRVHRRSPRPCMISTLA